jgi:hypothetical protein
VETGVLRQHAQFLGKELPGDDEGAVGRHEAGCLARQLVLLDGILATFLEIGKLVD